MSKKSKNGTYSAEAVDLKRAIIAARKNYINYPNVVGIAGGKKFKEGKWIDDISIQFFVSEKIAKDDIKKKLPSFVYGRSKGGKVDRTKKILTDVIDVGRIKPIGCAGTTIYSIGEGTVTLFFRNKAISGDNDYYILTCSHVIAPFSQPIGRHERIRSHDYKGDFAIIVRRSKCSDDYDIALAKVTDDALQQIGIHFPKWDCKIDGANVILKRFFPRRKIDRDLLVYCRLGRSKTQPATVMTASGGEGSIVYDGCNFNNLYLLNMGAMGGDSGGIVYLKDAAIGIVVLSDGINTWFQPLKEALRYLDKNIRCFSSDE